MLNQLRVNENIDMIKYTNKNKRYAKNEKKRKKNNAKHVMKRQKIE